MDLIETATNSYLEGLGLGVVVYEPLGHGTFPDFSLGNSVGIECTRLVNLVGRNGRQYNATELEPKIIHSLQNAMLAVKFGRLTSSYFVCIDYRVDIELKKAKALLKNYLEKLTLTNVLLPHKAEIDSHLKIEIIPSSNIFDTPFDLGAAMNLDGGGWVLDQLITQTKDAIYRKTAKAKTLSEKFDEWWFAVASSLTVGVSDYYVETLLTEIRQVDFWSKLILVDRLAPEKSRMLNLRQS